MKKFKNGKKSLKRFIVKKVFKKLIQNSIKTFNTKSIQSYWPEPSFLFWEKVEVFLVEDIQLGGPSF